MKRGRRTSAEQVVLELRPIAVQMAQGKSLALACKEAELSEQSVERMQPERENDFARLTRDDNDFGGGRSRSQLF